MNIVSVNKTCIVCEMPSPYNIVINDLDSNFAVAAVRKSETCISAKCLAEPKAYATYRQKFLSNLPKSAM
jgi:hypothetical protein